MSTFNDVVSGSNSTVERIGANFKFKGIAPWVECQDGTRLSVQASETHYCTPRTNDGPYSHVEVGFPTVAPPDTWAEYFDGDWDTDARTDSVYGYVPVELVREYIESHGGEA